MNGQNDPSTANSAKADGPLDGKLLDWLRGKVSDAEKALKTREDMAATWRSGTNADWVSAGAIHPATAGRTPGKTTRLREAQRQDRIAGKLGHELTMFRAVLAALVPAPNSTPRTSGSMRP